MIYLLDTCIWRKLLDHFPKKGSRFESVWTMIDEGIESGSLLSVDECFNELSKQFDKKQENLDWVVKRKGIFLPPTDEESLLIGELFLDNKMRDNIALKNILENRPSADAYLAAKGKKINATVVTAEIYKPNAGKLPNMCEKLGVPYLGFDDFMDIFFNEGCSD